ncbi:uncharacterized protein LOC111713505, partial [Eurytemora carolleeae]|uniref:uncharacterized protein LOC111713505 n=1 Tax=Eurytemora carolleeae TaxID=1294199 RepID=UPI000C7946D8
MNSEHLCFKLKTRLKLHSDSGKRPDMIFFILHLLIGLANAECCPKKLNGGDTYIFSEMGPDTSQYNCRDSCMYIKEGDSETNSRYCFAIGGVSQTQCIAENADRPKAPNIPNTTSTITVEPTTTTT